MSPRKPKPGPAPGDHFHAVWDALDKVIEAWETLPGGQRHSSRSVEQWLKSQMAPAINNARKAMGRKVPNVRD